MHDPSDGLAVRIMCFRLKPELHSKLYIICGSSDVN